MKKTLTIVLSITVISALTFICWSLASKESLAKNEGFLGERRGSVTIDLIRTSTLTNVDDTEGRWQFDGGEVYNGGSLVGSYIRRRRVSFGCTLNAAAVTLTILLQGQDPPQNITVQASHSFSNGGQIGSVSAASSDYNMLIGADVSGTYDSMTIRW